jgi:2-keto-4-pentenoate hydratase/2-oxohepta-3-ene-1,7-dioic acid hydratase in catechol pathway
MGAIEFNQQHLTPKKIVCIGKNYVAHIEEMSSPIPDDMVVFMKPASAIGDTLVAHRDEAIHYEGEICLLMGNQGVAGVGFGLDLTKRTTQAPKRLMEQPCSVNLSPRLPIYKHCVWNCVLMIKFDSKVAAV